MIASLISAYEGAEAALGGGSAVDAAWTSMERNIPIAPVMDSAAALGASFMTPPRKKARQPFISPDTKGRSNMPKRNRNVYQGGSSRARYSRRASGNTVITKYEKRLIKKNTKRGGASRLYDMVAPPLVIYNRAYYPRYLTYDHQVHQCVGKTVQTLGHIKSVMQIPMLTTREAATYILKSQAVPHTLSWEDNSDVWKGYPVLSDGSKTGQIDFKATNDMILNEHVEHMNNGDDILNIPDAQDLVDPAGPVVDSTLGYSITDSFIATEQPLSEGLYGYIEEIKYTYKITNPNEVKVTIDLMEVRPRDPITDIDELVTYSTAGVYEETIKTTVAKTHIQPLSCMKADWDNRKDFSTQIKNLNSQQMYPMAVGKDVSEDEWTNFDGGKYFNRYYKVIAKKSRTLEPGEVFLYDVVIPGFGFNFDRYFENQLTDLQGHEELTPKAGYSYKLKEMQSTFSRFLLLKFRGVPQYNRLPDQQVQSGDWVMGQKGYPIGLKCNLVARKYLKARLVPKTSKRIKMRTEGELDIDVFGKMTNLSKPVREFDASNMMTFNGKNVQAVNKYPNVLDVNVVSNTSGTSVP